MRRLLCLYFPGLAVDRLQREDPDLKYIGFHIPPDFVVGYGLDVGQRHRNLPEVRLWLP